MENAPTWQPPRFGSVQFTFPDVITVERRHAWESALAASPARSSPTAKAPQARYTPRTAKLWDECFARADANGDACMDFDMFVQGNDFDLSDIKVEQVSGDAERAVVRARFKNFGKDETVIFELIHGNQGWMIDEITSGCNVLTEHLQDKSTCM